MALKNRFREVEKGELYVRVKNYKFGRCKSVKEIFEDVADDVLNEFDNELIELENDVESGHFSNEEIANRVKELRGKIY